MAGSTQDLEGAPKEIPGVEGPARVRGHLPGVKRSSCIKRLDPYAVIASAHEVRRAQSSTSEHARILQMGGLPRKKSDFHFEARSETPRGNAQQNTNLSESVSHNAALWLPQSFAGHILRKVLTHCAS